jgi:CRISPR-associated protein Cas1
LSSSEFIPKASLSELPQFADRVSFLYVEHCLVNRQDGAITMTDDRGVSYIPAAGLGVLLLGPGTNITHRAVELIGDSGVSMIWVGERGVRYYAHGQGLTHSSRLQILQAKLVSNVRTRAVVARTMYALRFPDEDVSQDTMQVLRGKEGARVRSTYREWSKRTGVKWGGREYDPDDYNASDQINAALSCAHQCLYGLAHSAIVALGCSPALGFVHTGHDKSFVYDVADLYKAEISIPAAFEVCSQTEEIGDIERETRYAVREKIRQSKTMVEMVKTIRNLLIDSASEQDRTELLENYQEADASIVKLWDDRQGEVPNAVNYAGNYSG